MEKAAPRNNYHYNSSLQKFANKLRKNSTKSEACLWKYVLRAGTMKGFKFSRQRPVLNYIADFMCKELMLIIELDGITHLSKEAFIKDEKREADLKAIGFSILRFSDWEVLNRIVDVDIAIGEWIEKKIKEENEI